MDEQQIASYIQTLSPDIFGLNKFKTVHCERIKAGFHHFNFKVTISDGASTASVVIRLPTTPADAAALNNERWYIDLAGPAITPESIYYAAQTPFSLPLLITRFVSGTQQDFNALTKQQVRQLATTVRQMHDIRRNQFSVGDAMLPDHSGTLLDYTQKAISEFIDARYQAVAAQTPHDAKLYRQARQLLGQQLESADVSWASDTFSLCHGDIGGTNVLWSEDTVQLIDWDGANFGDPANEIGYIFAINNVTSDWRQLFLEAYLEQSPAPAVVQRIETHILKNRLFDVVWSIGKMHEAAIGSDLGLTADQAKQLYDERCNNLKKYLDI